MNDEQATEMLAWLRVIGTDPLRVLLGIHVRTQTDWVVFNETDGERNRDQVGRLAGITGRAVGNKWRVWREAGLLVDSPGFPHPRHMANPGAVGFDKPD